MIILKFTKKQAFTLSLKEKLLEKPQKEVKLTPIQPFKGFLIDSLLIESYTIYDEFDSVNNVLKNTMKWKKK